MYKTVLAFLLLSRHKHEHRHAQDGKHDGHTNVDEGLGTVGKKHEHRGVVQGLGLCTLPPGLQEAEAEPEVGQDTSDADGQQIVQILVVGTVEHAVARIHHVLEEIIHGNHVIGIRTVAKKLLQEAHVLYEVGKGDPPGEATSGAPAVIKIQKTAEGLPELRMISQICIDENAHNYNACTKQKYCPEPFRKLCKLLSHAFPVDKRIQEQQNRERQNGNPKHAVGAQGDEHAVDISHIYRSELRCGQQNTADSHGQQRDQDANAVAQYMTALLPEKKGRRGVEDPVGENRIVTHAADQGQVGNRKNQQ